MIPFNASRLRSRHNVLLRTWVGPRPINVPSRASSLSAIHRGLRSSEKARPQGFHKSSLNTAESRRPPKPSFQIRKGKKDITDTGPKPKSRRARFYDPNESFGKNSLVYQLKSGQLREKLAGLPGRKESAPEEREGRLSRESFFKEFTSSSERKSFSDEKDDRKARNPFQFRDSGDKPRSKFSSRPPRYPNELKDFDSKDSGDKPRSKFSSRPPRYPNELKDFDSKGSEDRPRSKFSSRPPRYPNELKDFDSKGSEDRPRSQFSSRPPRYPNELKDFDSRDSARSNKFTPSSRNGPTSWGSWKKERKERPSQPSTDRQLERDGDQTSSHRTSSRDHGPVRIPRTTAASQFLYGHSVVQAALKETTRKLYKLYLYCGQNREDAHGITRLTNMADRAGVPVTKVSDSDGLRMMDKMSEGRPHNGCILEASPLPQLPVKSLGALTEEPDSGFNVMLAHQSTEEAQINGTSNFIKFNLPPNRKPFVVLLDGIQDPGNLGAILRSAAFLGVNAVAITKGHSSSLTPVALKASAGASEVMKLLSVDSVLDFLTRSKEEGWLVYAAVAPTDRPRGGKHVTLDRVDTYDPLSISPTILVIGSEGEGLTTKTRRMADYEVSIPNPSGLSVVDSLNVSVATGILCSAFLKKQHAGGIFDKVIEPQEDESEPQLW